MPDGGSTGALPIRPVPSQNLIVPLAPPDPTCAVRITSMPNFAGLAFEPNVVAVGIGFTSCETASDWLGP